MSLSLHGASIWSGFIPTEELQQAAGVDSGAQNWIRECVANVVKHLHSKWKVLSAIPRTEKITIKPSTRTDLQ
jgi:hypothetical protein